ncbi:hypothetical protein LTR10_000965 [Elasticomyces elasticus]|nr:hypothetical protein LTR10_000965 [Elasticomyces elasticus]KAK4979786.1 hypothetical protein LTR42_000093 [Elasticomyces elasticus]
MAAYDIKQHFKGLRADTGRKKGRRDPFATGFEDDSEEEARSRQRDRTKQKEAAKKAAAGNPLALKTSVLDALRDSDDEWLGAPARVDRRPSPAPPQLASLRVTDSAGRRGSLDKGLQQNRQPRSSAIVQAAGSLAYLDDSDEDTLAVSPKRNERGPSPAPRKSSDHSETGERSHTPRGSRVPLEEQVQNHPQPSLHTVASPFAGTKYLQDSESDEDAVSSRNNSTDATVVSPDDEVDPLSPWESALGPKHPEVKRVDKPKQSNGSGISWRAFSASRTEQRSAEIEALQTSLKQRGKSIAFGTHAVTDDGKRVPIPGETEIRRAGSLSARGRGRGRGKSPPRRLEDTKVTEDEEGDGELNTPIYDPKVFKTNPFSAIRTATATWPRASQAQPPAYPPSVSTTSRIYDDDLHSPTSPTMGSAMTDSADSILSKLTVSPQTIPEGQQVEHSLDGLMSPMSELANPLSRNSSTRSTRMTGSRRIPNAERSRRSSRRSASATTSISPAQAFLSSWNREGMTAEPAQEKPDDEGKSFGLNNEYIIGRTINQGGFGVIKEAHTMTESGKKLVYAVKIVRKAITDSEGADGDKLQQELEHEVSVWRELHHSHILRLHVVYETDFATFCIMDLNVGGTLFDAVRRCRSSAAQNDGRKGLDPKLATSYAYQLASALRYLHQDMRVCHRDVKLENCLIDMSVPNAETEGGNLRLCDFGLADFLHSDSSTDTVSPERSGATTPSGSGRPTRSSVIGTLEYASPRGLSVNRKLFETAGDVWAYGVIIYALCTGELPFRHPMPSKTVDLILQADWDDGALKQAAAGGDAVIELVKGCLERDIDARLTIAEAMRSPWFAGREEADTEDGGAW